jgi:superfamily II DNA/RNA helicase
MEGSKPSHTHSPVPPERVDEEQHKRGQELEDRLDQLLGRLRGLGVTSASHSSNHSRASVSNSPINSPSPLRKDTKLWREFSQGDAPGASPEAEEVPTLKERSAAAIVAEEAAARRKAEEEAARKKAEEEAAARKKAEEEAAARKKAEEEAAARKKAEEEAARKKAEEKAAARRKAEEEAAARKKAEEEAARKKAEEEAARKKAEEEAARKKAEEKAAARRKAEEKAARKKAGKEAAACKEAEANSRGGASCPTPDDGRHGTVKSLKNHREINFAVSFVEKKKRKR